MAAIRHIKRDNYRHIAHFAQRTESQFMFCHVVPRIRCERPHLFIAMNHDSVLTTAADAQYVRGVMLGEFSRLGVFPQVEVDVYNAN
jgi:hypothetical protein